MKSEWRTDPLRDVVSYIAKGIPPSYVEAESDKTVRVLNQKCNRNFDISYSESRLHDLSKRSVPEEKYLRDDDILINSTGTGTVGRIAQLSKVPCPTIVDGHMIVLRGNEKVTQRYLGYVLKAQQDIIFQLDEGSTGQTEMNRDRLLSEIEVSYPVSLREQDAIAATLFAFDARIANNKEINHHFASTRSVADSSPDIKRGKRVSRISARRAFSLQFLAISQNIGATASEYLVAVLALNSISVFKVSTGLRFCCAVPLAILIRWPFISGCRNKKYQYGKRKRSLGAILATRWLSNKLSSVTIPTRPTLPVSESKTSPKASIQSGFSPAGKSSTKLDPSESTEPSCTFLIVMTLYFPALRYVELLNAKPFTKPNQFPIALVALDEIE